MLGVRQWRVCGTTQELTPRGARASSPGGRCSVTNSR